MDANEKQSDELSLRQCRPDEAAALSDLAARLFIEAYGPTHPEPELSRYLRSSFNRECLARELREPGVRVFLAVAGPSELIGYAYLRERTGDVPPSVAGRKSCEILRFYVDKRWHGRGAANALMKSCEDAARESGAATLWLQVWSAALRPIAYYAKAGFNIVGPAQFHFGERVDSDYVMSRTLESPGPAAGQGSP